MKNKKTKTAPKKPLTFDYLEELAEQGNGLAGGALAQFFASGDGTPAERAKALKWCRWAAEDGVAYAQCALGAAYADGDSVPKNSAEAAKWYRRAAEQGDADAQRILGAMYEDGDGVPKDGAEAIKWVRKAAEQGSAPAQFFLGAMLMHNFGQNVPRGAGEAAEAQRRAATEAAFWYRKAAEQGNIDAQYYLGMFYHSGRGVGGKDLAEAHAWMTVAGALGSDKARDHAARLEKDMSSEQINCAKRLADGRIARFARADGQGSRQEDR